MIYSNNTDTKMFVYSARILVIVKFFCMRYGKDVHDDDQVHAVKNRNFPLWQNAH
jgi:hypothetical protein